MLFFEEVILSDIEKALTFADKQFSKIITAGKHRFSKFGSQYRVQRINLLDVVGLQHDRDILALVERYPDRFVDHISVHHTAIDELLLVWDEQRLIDILYPGKKAYLWTRPQQHVETITIVDGEPIPEELLRLFNRRQDAWSRLIPMDYIQALDVPDQHVAIVVKGNQSPEVLPTGQYRWWSLTKNFRIRLVDLRLRSADVSGQEILTKDRVSIRLNLLANWRVVDPKQVVSAVENHDSFLYQALQLALRTVVATKTLDELLADKNLLNTEIRQIVEPEVAQYGIELKTVGVKYVILPGDMKQILAQVVEAQKSAEANVIRRREETQATRSLHNTAKVMENNPVLLRLKELETLEKITDKIASLTVYGGLDGVLNDLVSINGSLPQVATRSRGAASAPQGTDHSDDPR